jgi:hypothetical protein
MLHGGFAGPVDGRMPDLLQPPRPRRCLARARKASPCFAGPRAADSRAPKSFESDRINLRLCEPLHISFSGIVVLLALPLGRKVEGSPCEERLSIAIKSLNRKIKRRSVAGSGVTLSSGRHYWQDWLRSLPISRVTNQGLLLRKLRQVRKPN